MFEIVRNLTAKWKVTEARHLSPNENRGKHHLYIDVLDKEGDRLYGATVQVWNGPSLREATIDKPLHEPGTNMPIWYQDTLDIVSVNMEESDQVRGIHTRHASDGPGNSLGHHSYIIVFQEDGDTGDESDDDEYMSGYKEGAIDTLEQVKEGLTRILTELKSKYG